MTTAIGTTKELFNRQLIYTDPQYIQGLGLWRYINVATVAEEVKKFGAILPIVSTESQANYSINLSFDIGGLPEITGARNSTTLTQRAQKLANNPAIGLPKAPEISDVKTILPINKTNQGDTIVFFFDIASLGYMDVSLRKPGYRSIRVKTNSYNSSRSTGPSLTATAPMVEDTEGSSATVSFDISDLNYV